MIKLRFAVFLLLISLFILISFGIELHYMRLEAVPLLTRILLLFLLNVTIISLLTLVFFVSKSLVKLYFERRYRVLGYKFKTKLVVVLCILTLIPATFTFIVSSGFVTNVIDRWFAPQLKEPLSSSIEIAKSLYDHERQRVLDYAKSLSHSETTKAQYSVNRFRKKPENATETIKAAFEGKEDVEVISGVNGDIVRAVVPEYEKGKQIGIVVVETVISKNITEHIERIQGAYEDYLTLESWRTPIKTNYLLILGFITLLIVFMALWIALRIAANITEPIKHLALATEQIATGNLNIHVDLQREDEVGLLVQSFNHMVKELKEGKESLEVAYVESNKRRLFMENILDSINSGVIMLDTAGTILMINGAACSILNIRPDIVVNKHYKDLLSLIQSDELQRIVKGIEGREFKPVNKEIEAFIDRRKIILRVFITSLKDFQKYVGMLVVFNDITDVIRAQKAIAWQEIARRIAHEIKNPLTPIKLSTERLIKKWHQRDTDFEQVFERSTKGIINEVNSLKRLVDEFSRFGKMPEIHKSPIALVHVVDEIADLYKGYKGIEIDISKPENNLTVEIDKEQFRRVMINIFDNAMQAMTNNGKITVSINFDLSANKACIEIADNGPGIQDEDKERLFLPYFSTRKNGTGLGLAIADRIITEHGGHIRVRDNQPNGTVFSIEIPIKEH